MKRYTVYFKNDSVLSKVVSFPFLTLKLLLGTFGAKLVSENTSGKVKKMTFDAEKRPTKADLSVGKNEILAIIPHTQGVGRYKRNGIVRKLAKSVMAKTKGNREREIATPKPLTPMQVAKAYDYPAPTAALANQCIAIVELGGSVDADKISAYCKKMGVAAPKISIEYVDDAVMDSDGPDGADGEVYLDVCVAAAVAPGVQILVIFAPNSDQGFIDAINLAVNSPLKPCAISVSWGQKEKDYPAVVRKVFDAALEAAQAAGLNVFVAAGDNGSSDGGTGVNVDYPASSPFAIGCGGTELVLNPDGTRYAETVWGADGATGGGISVMYPRPAFQKAIKNPYDSRLVPDIAANGSPSSGYIIEVDGDEVVVAGTSAVAPLISALCALMTATAGKSIGNMQSMFYDGSIPVFDVIHGSNGKYKAQPGFDLCSGNGVPGTGLVTNPNPSRSIFGTVLGLLGLK